MVYIDVYFQLLVYTNCCGMDAVKEEWFIYREKVTGATKNDAGQSLLSVPAPWRPKDIATVARNDFTFLLIPLKALRAA